ncbi:unnamed protein product [Larinioides sclopetarius]|uniref:Uncharacterized protein n=1 Tax=Larinioides sclopetarius TaxID=280406 RepID=A0AAV2BI99_9ARAC
MGPSFELKLRAYPVCEGSRQGKRGHNAVFQGLSSVPAPEKFHAGENLPSEEDMSQTRFASDSGSFRQSSQQTEQK